MIRQQNRFIAQFLCQLPGCLAKLPDTADDLGGNVRQLFRRFLLQQRKRPLTERQIVFFHNSQCVCAGRAVRGCRTGGDHIRRVAQNIGKHNDLHMGGGAPLGKSPALDGGQPLADGIYLHNVRPAGKKLVRDGLQFRPLHQRLFKQSAAAAGEQEQHRILWAYLCGYV